MTTIDKWDKRYLDLAEFISTWSKDPSTQVGAVIVNERNEIVSLGYNGLPRGVEDREERLNNREIKYRMIVHAERNAILFARQDLTGCTLYTVPFMPCSVCAGFVIQSGIKNVVSYEVVNSRWEKDFYHTLEMFDEAGINLKLYARPN